MHKYDDIIEYDYVGFKKNRMSINDRSAQFAPFAALDGYGDAICEAGKFQIFKVNLTDEEKEDIGNKILLSLNKEIMITYFDDEDYINYTGKVRFIDTIYKMILFYDKKKIKIDNIIYIEIKK